MGLYDEDTDDEVQDSVANQPRYRQNGGYGGLFGHQNFLQSVLREENLPIDDHLEHMRMHLLQRIERMEEERFGGANPLNFLENNRPPLPGEPPFDGFGRRNNDDRRALLAN